MFLKKWHKLAFYGDQKISIAIGVMQKVTEFFFRRHLTCPHHQMASKIFWSPKRESEGCFSKMISHTCTPYNNQKILVDI